MDSHSKDASRRAIAVFGSSEPPAGTPVYETARELGGLLATAGYAVVTGGYGGVMEGASRGARDSGGEAVGVVCDLFRARSPNRYLTEVISTRDLFERSRELIERSDGFVVLPGKSGTLAEVALLWALHRGGALGPRPVVLLGDGWRHLLRHLVRSGMMEPARLEITRVVSTPGEALDVLGTFLAEGARG